MGRQTALAPLPHRQALNKTLVFTKDAPVKRFLEVPREPGYWSQKRKRGPWD